MHACHTLYCAQLEVHWQLALLQIRQTVTAIAPSHIETNRLETDKQKVHFDCLLGVAHS